MPDNPIQIADAALYLKTHNKSLGITDPYELTQPQLQASVKLLADQRPLLKFYRPLASQEISAFKNGDVNGGAGWPYQVSQLQASEVPDRVDDPERGSDGLGGLLAARDQGPAPELRLQVDAIHQHPEGAGSQAVTYGETPDNSKACSFMNQLQAGSCALYHANAPAAYFKTIALWKTPIADVRQRQAGLHAVFPMGDRVEYPGQMTGPGGPKTSRRSPECTGRHLVEDQRSVVAPAVGSRHLAVDTTARLVPCHLRGRAGGAADHGVLADQRLSLAISSTSGICRISCRSSPRRRTCRTSGALSGWPPV